MDTGETESDPVIRDSRADKDSREYKDSRADDRRADLRKEVPYGGI